jgi:ABC-type lipoprotein release transport system permease subunit
VQISLTAGFILFSLILRDVLASSVEPMVAELISGAFYLNTLTMFLLSMLVICLTSVRQIHAGVLYIMGLSIRDIVLLLLVESLVVLLLGMATGVLIGFGLTWMIIPSLSQTLSTVAGPPISLEWSTLIRLCILLTLGYMAFVLFRLRRIAHSGINPTAQFGDT